MAADDSDRAITDRGHYRVLRAGAFTPGARVAPVDAKRANWRGTVKTLFPTYGAGVAVTVEWTMYSASRLPPWWSLGKLRVLR
ncbi:MAG TPA: hypothetical protein VGK74_22405 [Symbiobacteriaceae bacterium]